MTAEQTADVKEKELEGQAPVEGSSATTDTPNPPENEALSGVGQTEAEPQTKATDAQGETEKAQEVAAPESEAEGEPPQQQSDDKVQMKAKARERFNELLDQLKQYKERFGPIPAGQQPPMAGAAEPHAVNRDTAPSLPAVVAPQGLDNDPLEQAISQKTAEASNLYGLYANEVDEGRKAQIAAQYNRVQREVESLKEQRIASRVMQQFQQYQIQQQRLNRFMSEAAEVNAAMPLEAKFMDGNGRVVMESPAFQAMAAKAYSEFGLLPQQLVNTPDILAYCAKDIAWRLNGAVSMQAALTQKKTQTQRAVMQKRTGLETGGTTSPPASVGGNDAKRAKEIMSKRANGTATEDEISWLMRYRLEQDGI